MDSILIHYRPVAKSYRIKQQLLFLKNISTFQSGGIATLWLRSHDDDIFKVERDNRPDYRSSASSGGSHQP